MLFIAWLNGQQNQVRPMFPPNTSQEDLIRASKSFDLAQQVSARRLVEGSQAFPVRDIIKAVDGPRGIFADEMPVPTGGAMIKRTPNDPLGIKGGIWHDNMKINIPDSGSRRGMTFRRVRISRLIITFANRRSRHRDKQYLVSRRRCIAVTRARPEKYNSRERCDGATAQTRLQRAYLTAGVRLFPERRKERRFEDAESQIFYDGQQ
jgi:hypothetical protein